MTTSVRELQVQLDSPVVELFRTLTGPSGRYFVPAADSYARDGYMVVKIDLPGVNPKKIHMKLVDGELVVTGERKPDVKQEKYYREESAFGHFERHIYVPKGVKRVDIKTGYVNGVLELDIPKKATKPVPTKVAKKR